MSKRFRHPDALPTSRLQWVLLCLLTSLFLATAVLPVFRPESLFYPHFNQQVTDFARLDNLGLIYKNDTHGTYAVIDSNWTFTRSLAKDEKVLFRLLNSDSREASHIDLQPDVEQGLTNRCQTETPCHVAITGSIRVPTESLSEQYQLTTEIQRAGHAAALTQIITLPRSEFDLQRMGLGLLATLLICGACQRLLLSALRQGLRWRLAGILLLGNLSFLLLNATLCFHISEFIVWAEYRYAHYYLSWGLMLLGWLVCVLLGRHLYMGLVFTALFAIGLLANFAKIHIYGTSLGGDDLSNLLSLVTILVGDHLLWLSAGLLGLVLMLWKLRWFGWLLRVGVGLVAFFGFSVFAIQASNKVLGPNINYFNTESSYHREMVRRGPSLYLFDLINGLVRGNSIYAFPNPNPTPDYPAAATTTEGHADWDLVIVMQYEAMWLDWKGGICKPAPSLRVPARTDAIISSVRSPTTGGMTVLAEFEMNTGLPVGLLRQGIVPYYYLRDGAQGLAQSARQLGYQTHFYHPYKANFWGRSQAIPAMGYQQLHFDDQFTSLDQKGSYVSDQALIGKVLQQATSAPGQPQFIYTVTMQGHGPFNQARYGQHELDAACPGLSDSDRQTLNTYYTGVVDEMASLQSLLDGLHASGLRYLLIAFGDHQPYLMNAGHLVLPAHAKTEQTFDIPFMVFAPEGSAPLKQQYQSVRQLFQAGQVTRQLLGQRHASPTVEPALLHPVLGKETAFDPASYLLPLHTVFRDDTFHQ
ncbi:LTA synthase family protein [Pseudaeromonas sharmana]|uniref:LTA synthase family protein n=1 Tax=Pseudaeromonas sharmana TaxID=328412 RepID=A0ABV8CLE4_9GAMM